MTIATRKRVLGPLLDQHAARKDEEAERRRAWDAARADEERRRDEALRAVGWNKPRPTEEELKSRQAAAAEAGARAREARAAWDAFRRQLEAEAAAARSAVDAAIAAHDLAAAVDAEVRSRALDAVLARTEKLAPDWRSPALAMHGYEAV